VEGFLQNYGLWILVGAVFLAMHWFGMGCGGGHARRCGHEDRSGKPGDEKREATHAGRECH